MFNKPAAGVFIKQTEMTNGHPVFLRGLIKCYFCTIWVFCRNDCVVVFVLFCAVLKLWFAGVIDLFLMYLFFIIRKRVVPSFVKDLIILRFFSLFCYEVENFVLTTLKPWQGYHVKWNNVWHISNAWISYWKYPRSFLSRWGALMRLTGLRELHSEHLINSWIIYEILYIQIFHFFVIFSLCLKRQLKLDGNEFSVMKRLRVGKSSFSQSGGCGG